MRFYLRHLLFVATLFILTACQSTDQSTEKLKFLNQNFQITDVVVRLHENPKVKNKLLKPTESFKDVLTNTFRNYAAEHNATRPNANIGYHLKVDITEVHFKNALVSLIVGDANRLKGTASIVDPNTSSVVHTAPANYVDAASGALNGISGAVLSVVVKKEAAEATMAKGSAKNVMKFLYPNVNLSKGSKQRLKDKTVLEPRTTAISSLSVQAAIAQPSAVSNDATTEPTVITLNE